MADMAIAMTMNDTDLLTYLEDYEGEDWNRSPFDNHWYKALIIALYSIVFIGCIVGKYGSSFCCSLCQHSRLRPCIGVACIESQSECPSRVGQYGTTIRVIVFC